MDNQNPTDPNQGGFGGGGQAPVVDPNAGGQPAPEPQAPVSQPAEEPVQPQPGVPGSDTGGVGGDQGGQNPAGGAPAV